ncbi:MAG: 4Fe-4S binding protein [Deltaproteobacteria bacterium]|nr:4Fe-4S binding protein [Deltaproteobacteria bacterium]
MTRKGCYSIEIYHSWCKRCGICVAFCPRDVLAQDGGGALYVKDLERCTGCQWCELRCPDFAIHVRPQKERGGKGKNEEEDRGRPDQT